MCVATRPRAPISRNILREMGRYDERNGARSEVPWRRQCGSAPKLSEPRQSAASPAASALGSHDSLHKGTRLSSSQEPRSGAGDKYDPKYL